MRLLLDEDVPIHQVVRELEDPDGQRLVEIPGGPGREAAPHDRSPSRSAAILAHPCGQPTAYPEAAGAEEPELSPDGRHRSWLPGASPLPPTTAVARRASRSAHL